MAKAPDMRASNVLLFSIKPKWVDAILCGDKTFELRRRPPKLSSSVPALIYATMPVCALVARCTMGPVLSGSPVVLWQDVGKASCVTEDEFEDYFHGCHRGHAIVVSRPSKIEKSLSLNHLRQRIGFSAPQGWSWASRELLAILEASA